MAEELVFEIKTDSVEQSLANLTKSTNELKEANKLLAKEVAAGNKEAAVAIERNNAVIKVQQDEYRTLQNNLKGYLGAKKQEVDTTNFSNNSIKANRELLKQLTAQYIGLKNPSQEATNQIKRLSDTLKQQEGVIGDTRRNVGNYAEGIKQALNDLRVFGVNVGQVTGAIGGMKDAFTAAGGGVQGFNAALLVTGLPVLIQGITMLTDSLKTFRPVADFVSDAVEGLSGAFNALATGRDIFDVAQQAVQLNQALRDLEDNQISAGIVTAQYDSQIKQLLLSLRNKSNSYADNIRILGELDEVEKARFEFQKKLAQQEFDLEKSKFGNKTGLYDAEIQALIERGNVERRYSDEYIARLAKDGGVTEDVIRKTIKRDRENQKRLAEDAEKKAKFSDEEIKRLAALQARIFEIDGESAILQEKFANRRSDIDQKEADRREKVAKESAERIKEINQGVIDAVNELIAEQESLDEFQRKREEKRLQGITDEFNATVAHYNALQTIEINAIDASAENEETKQKKRLEVQLKYLELNLNATRAFYTADGEFTQAEIDNLKVLESQIAKIRAQLTGLTTKKEKDPTLAEALGLTQEDLGNISQGIGLVEQAVSKISDAFNNEFNLRLQGIEAAKNAELAAIDELDVSEKEKDRRRRNAERQAARAEWEIQVQQFKTNQAVAIVQTIINTAQAIVAQLANPTPYVGIALAAVAAATGAAQIGVISSQQPPPPPKFATGVIGLNGPGTETSDSIPAYLSKGESVMTAKATKQFAPMLAQMEMAVGNKPNWDFSSGHFANGVIGQYGDGGSFVRSISQPQPLTAADLTKAISSMPAPVVSVKQIDKVRGAERSVATSATL